jgi:tetratricopeptide (TPR) repeat protein
MSWKEKSRRHYTTRNKMRNQIQAWLLLLFIALLSCNRGGGEFKVTNAADSARIVIEELNRKIAGDAENAALYQARSDFYLKDRQFDNALKDINRAITLQPKNPDLYIHCADIYLLMGQVESAREALVKGITVDPQSRKALLAMARLNLVIRDYPRTFEYIQKALAINNVYPEAYYSRALAYLESGDTNKAVTDLLKAVDQNQGYYDALVQLGQLYSIRNDKIAADYLKNALALRPDSKEALYLLGMFYQETNQHFLAIETYKRLQKADSTFRNAPYNIGYICMVYLKDYPQAIASFSTAIKTDPGYYEAYFNRGFASELMGAYDKAYKDYQMALKIKVNYQNAVDGLNRLDKLKVRR